MGVDAPSYKDSEITVSDVVNYLSETIKLHCQHVLAKSGLLVGTMSHKVSGILICLDITEAVLDEAIEKGCNFLITNQPLCQEPLMTITTHSYAGNCIIKAIQHGLSIYLFGTNLDDLGYGASHRLANLMDLREARPLIPQQVALSKLVTFVPAAAEQYLITALHNAGAVLDAQHLGGYVSTISTQLFYAMEQPHSYTEDKSSSKLEMAQERQLTFIVPLHSKEKVVQVLLHVHPYPKVPYYLEQIEVRVGNVGRGVVGSLGLELPGKYFLKYLKTKLALRYCQHNNVLTRPIRNIAVYAGEGRSMLDAVFEHEVDAFITTGLQYEQFLQGDGKILMIDIGYYAIRLGVKKMIFALLSKEFNNIVILRCKTVTNPIHDLND